MEQVDIYCYYRDMMNDKYYDDFKVLHWYLAMGLKETLIIFGRWA